MKSLASITALILPACAYASTGVAVPPPSDFVDTEAVTNVLWCGGGYGVYYTNDVNKTKFWLKGNAPVGFPWNARNPIHQ